jgi:hypothetical protein
VQHADPVVGGDLQQEGVLRVGGAIAVVPHPHAARRRGAQRLQPRLQQPPVRRHAGRQPDLGMMHMMNEWHWHMSSTQQLGPDNGRCCRTVTACKHLTGNLCSVLGGSPRCSHLDDEEAPLAVC